MGVKHQVIKIVGRTTGVFILSGFRRGVKLDRTRTIQVDYVK